MTKKVKKILKTSLSTIFGFGLLAAIISSSIINSGTNTSDLFAEIVVSDNTSVLADKSFSETTFNGYRDFLKDRNHHELDKPVQDFREGFGLWRRPGSNDSEKVTTFKGIFDNGKDLIIAPGFNHQQAIENLAHDPAFSKKGFLLLDAGLNKPAGNVSTVEFRMEQAGFQSGVAASQLLSVNEHIFARDGSLKIGGFVGIPLPSTMDFLIGFQKGMVAWNEANPGKTQIEWVNLGNNIGAYTSGSFGIGDGRQISLALLNSGADAIIPIAGPQTLDAIAEIRLQSRPVIVIGVDSAQELNDGIQQPIPGLGAENIKNADGSSDSGNNNIIQFSAEKKLDVAVQGILTAISNIEEPNKSSFEGSDYGGFGYRNVIALGPSGAGAVGISNAGKDYFTKGLGKAGEEFEDVIAGLETNPTFKQMIGEGEILLFNSSDGLPAGGAVTGGFIQKYPHGLENLLEDNGFKDEDRLNGSHFAPPSAINHMPPILVDDIQSLRKKDN